MTDRDANPLPSNLRPERAARQPSSLYRETDAPGPSLLTDTELHHDPPVSAPAARGHAEHRLSSVHRAYKQRSSGGFLLADALNRQGSARRRDAETHTHAPEKRQRRSVEQQQHGFAGTQISQKASLPRTAPSNTQEVPPGMPRVGGPPDENPTSNTITNRDSLAGDTAVGSSPRASIARLDMESAQIVNMALNLSESRRLASRRNVSQPTPPRLAPLPDNAPGGSLRYHLQQQRKMSRTVSPKPDRSPRVGSGRFTPLQPALEPATSYRYHFSTSTLARAQKAKDYLELMAQYRRLLELVPPLEPQHAARHHSTTPPLSPSASAPVSRTSTNDPEPKIGRPYNPLQYVRNRKVRARERRALDGEASGFTDVLKVSEWVDDVAKWVATGQARQPGNPALPPFAGAQTAELQASPPPASARGATAKPKRPRVDWVIDPADLLADAYWLELDDNKKLVEDRHWRRVFPQSSDTISRPMSRDNVSRLTTPGSGKVSLEAHTPSEKNTPEPASSRHEHEHVLEAAKDRAQQKLRALKGSHHRHTSSFTNRDLLRLHRGSLSESSDTDSDRRRRAKGAPSSAVRSLLEKQIEEMIAREQREAESHPLYDHETQRIRSAPMTPEREPRSFQDVNRPRADTHHADLSEAKISGFGLKPIPLPRSPPQAAGRTSLDVPRIRRFSVDDDTSQPNSPGLRPSPDIGRVPALSTDMSPMSSRAGSPHRNPLTKVKGIFRDRSKERNAEIPGESGATTLTSPPPDGWTGTLEPASAISSPPQRRPSRSPNGERPLGHRSHKSLSSAKLRGEDGGISFRSLLRGPRIDTVLRSGVSKVSDMLWRKEGDESSSTSSSDSEPESRGRSRRPRHGRSFSEYDAKQLLDAPQLASNYKPSQDQGLLQHPPVRPISRRSSRFELLKPPRIDVQQASPSTSPPPVQVRVHEPAVGSDAESQRGLEETRTAAADRNAALALPHDSTTPSSRQWSITDRSSKALGAASVSKREIARLRALLLSSGIHAMEMDRRARARKLLPSPTIVSRTAQTNPPVQPLAWTEVADLAPDAATKQRLLTMPLAQADIYPVAARTLAGSVQASAARFQTLSTRFTTETSPALVRRVESLRGKVAEELTDLAQSAIDAADEANHDLVAGQRLKVKMATDAMNKMFRRRRRRFRWVRRAGWLVVEWLLVGCMWYVWFLVMIARIALGVGKGVVRGVRWLLWL
ncbi:hypothetical protein C7999DRAFT_33358 [Corynascus novoguineensis]|uniref:Uncharacterized protein n=1 Tax=Corynascus novoguineensis TaxID=1126955 RepID=A0AAN7CQ49_9PEZI|nr:hypothetical protein C7999DRAFT_33358 [Corynascus novoguineensis]